MFKKQSWFNAALATVVTLAVAGGIYGYWQYTELYPSTDDAYVETHRVDIAAEAAGRVTEIRVENNQFVKKGDVLFAIDDEPYRIAVERAKAQLDLAKQTHAIDKKGIMSADAKVKEAGAHLILAEKTAGRILALARKGRVSRAEADTAREKLRVAQASMTAAKSALKQAHIKLGGKRTGNAQVRLAQANLDQALLNLSRTKVYAPASGMISKYTLRQGDLVVAGKPLFALVEIQKPWIEANFKETQLKRIRVGQTVQVSIDMYPGVTFQGKVESMSAGSGSAFSLLPPENATGNWVKVTQRFPVRISLDKLDDQHPLRLGASAAVTVDTQA